MLGRRADQGLGSTSQAKKQQIETGEGAKEIFFPGWDGGKRIVLKTIPPQIQDGPLAGLLHGQLSTCFAPSQPIEKQRARARWHPTLTWLQAVRGGENQAHDLGSSSRKEEGS